MESHQGIVMGVQFSGTTLQGGDLGSQSPPSSHTLNSSHQSGSTRVEIKHIKNKPSTSKDNMMRKHSAPSLGGHLCPLW